VIAFGGRSPAKLEATELELLNDRPRRELPRHVRVTTLEDGSQVRPALRQGEGDGQDEGLAIGHGLRRTKNIPDVPRSRQGCCRIIPEDAIAFSTPDLFLVAPACDETTTHPILKDPQPLQEALE